MDRSTPPSFDERYREPVYCLRCNEVLYIDGEGSCPACGLQFNRDDAETFRQQPMFLRWKFWFPGLCLSIVSGVISYAICLTGGDLGFALFVAVPISFGAILGYATRVYIWLLGLLGILVVTCVVMTLVSMNIAGLFCGLMLGAVFLFPAMFGIVLGFVLRLVLKASQWDQRWFLPLIGFILLPYLAQGIENNLPPRRETAIVRTLLTVDATPEQAWNAVMFYEEVTHEEPWLLRLSLPRPLRSEGDKTREGEIVRCFYDRGYLCKRISRVEERKLLAFQVVEQRLHFERDIKLLGGSYEILPDGKRQTRIVLTTRYERRLAPRWIWEPVERHVVHTLHGHVLEGMRRKIQDDGTIREPAPYEPPERNSPGRRTALAQRNWHSEKGLDRWPEVNATEFVRLSE